MEDTDNFRRGHSDNNHSVEFNRKKLRSWNRKQSCQRTTNPDHRRLRQKDKRVGKQD